MKSSNNKKTLFSRDFYIFFEFTKERIKVWKLFWHHSMCFETMHILLKVQFFIRISTVVKLENKNRNFEKQGKRGVFFKLTYLNEWISYKLHIYVKIMLIILPIINIKIL